MFRALKLHDPLLFGLAIVATLLGLFFIYDAGYARAVQSDKGIVPPEFWQQFKYAGFAVIAWILGAIVPSERWRRASTWLFGITLLLLIAVMVVGKEMNGAKRWIDVGPISIQPSELAKLTAILYLAAVFAGRKTWPEVARPARDWAQYLDRNLAIRVRRWFPAILVLVGILLIEKEPDLGTGAVVAATSFALCALGRTHWKTLVAGLALAGIGTVVMVKAQPYRVDRIINHANRWKKGNVDDTGYQTVQAELGQAIGGLVGVGPANGRVKQVIPAPTTDFIMGTIGEEFGLAGALAVILLMAAMCLRLLQLAQRAPTEYGKLVLAGTACWFGIQASVNVMMANGFLPAIGIPLPFISSGGSSLVALWLTLGVCNSALAPLRAKEAAYAVDRHGRRDRRAHLSRA